jgi:hypothetical protein
MAKWPGGRSCAVRALSPERVARSKESAGTADAAGRPVAGRCRRKTSQRAEGCATGQTRAMWKGPGRSPRERPPDKRGRTMRIAEDRQPGARGNEAMLSVV